METSLLCPSERHKHGGSKATETSVIEICSILTLEFRDIEINSYFRAKAVQLAKTDSSFDLCGSLQHWPKSHTVSFYSQIVMAIKLSETFERNYHQTCYY